MLKLIYYRIPIDGCETALENGIIGRFLSDAYNLIFRGSSVINNRQLEEYVNANNS